MLLTSDMQFCHSHEKFQLSETHFYWKWSRSHVFMATYRPAVDDEDGLGCSVEATLLQTRLLASLQVAAFLVQV